ncbi:MAG TPA: FAD-binding domain-containing protein [Novosphingobium sp.]|nr:FAD-binding domain-containing protein [Novosphingobium sp.]
MIWEPTRAAGLARLQAFLPAAGRAYAASRNVDRGPADRSNVSALSPWLRRRLITEDEVVAAVLSRHSAAAAEKFVQEVAWRTYWKGWLELRSALLESFNAERIALKDRLERDRDLALRFRRAAEGESGIACFDAWVAELRERGWLHNHARMWFASIWIFTLGLPWQLGADFFYKHLLDADPASNTLSWRWVAGLHTTGKHYLARAENIERNTLGRFAPYGQLNEAAQPLIEADPVPSVTPLAPAGRVGAGPFALLLTEEDLHPESWAPPGEIAAIAMLPSAQVHAPGSPGALFSEGALADAAARAEAHFGRPCARVPAADLPAWLAGKGLTQLVTSQAPTGLIAWQLRDAAAALSAQGAHLIPLRRPWDEALWPLATAGFFKLKTKLPAVIARLGLDPAAPRLL